MTLPTLFTHMAQLLLHLFMPWTTVVVTTVLTQTGKATLARDSSPESIALTFTVRTSRKSVVGHTSRCLRPTLLLISRSLLLAIVALSRRRCLTSTPLTGLFTTSFVTSLQAVVVAYRAAVFWTLKLLSIGLKVFVALRLFITGTELAYSFINGLIRSRSVSFIVTKPRSMTSITIMFRNMTTVSLLSPSIPRPVRKFIEAKNTIT